MDYFIEIHRRDRTTMGITAAATCVREEERGKEPVLCACPQLSVDNFEHPPATCGDLGMVLVSGVMEKSRNLLFEQALLIEGAQIPNPTQFARRLNNFLVKAL